MYLAGRKVIGVGFYSGYNKLPKRLTDEELLDAVKKLKTGDPSAVEPLVLTHLGLTIQIVGRYVSYFPHKTDDLMGTATMSLVESVNKFSFVAKDDNITGYIVSCIHGSLARFVREQDHTIQISTRGFEKAVTKAKQENVQVSNFLAQTWNIDALTRGESEQRQEDNFIENISKYDDATSIEIEEIIVKCNFTRFEYLILQKLMQGVKETDIAKELNYSKQRISQVKKIIANKLTPHFVEDSDFVTEILKEIK